MPNTRQWMKSRNSTLQASHTRIVAIDRLNQPVDLGLILVLTCKYHETKATCRLPDIHTVTLKHISKVQGITIK